jgi:hypothetical protein
MRTVAQYAFTGASADAPQANALFTESRRAVEAWLKSKGIVDPHSSCNIQINEGRTAEFEMSRRTCKSGSAYAWTLSESSGHARFSTALGLASAGAEVAFTCNLSRGSNSTSIAPRPFTARCPRVVKDVLRLAPGWRVGDTIVECEALKFSDSEETKDLVTRLLAPSRTLPVIIASRYDGFLLHPTLVDVLAADICGLGLVADINDEAAREVTRILGKEWSCYNGAIRIYWPRLDTQQNPRFHPLWTSERLMYFASGTEDASRRIRGAIRKRLFSVSAFAVEQPPLFDRLEDESAHEAMQEKMKFAANAQDYQGLAEEYGKENDHLRLQLRQERENVQQLRQDLYQLQMANAWADADEDLTPDEETPLVSVQDAVDKARKLYATQLTFGGEVADGIGSVAPNAGPPQKIFDYLKALANLVDKRRDGGLGDTMLHWLKTNGVNASSESETIQNNRDEMQKRKWHDGRAKRAFITHLKPTDATSPDRCVRIYFDWDDASDKAVIGWIGRHP